MNTPETPSPVTSQQQALEAFAEIVALLDADDQRSSAVGTLRRYLAHPAAAATVRVPDGWVLVPRRPTVPMLAAAMDMPGAKVLVGKYANTLVRQWRLMIENLPPQPVTNVSVLTPPELEPVVRALHRFNDCAMDDNDVDMSRNWFDALTTMGLLERVQRSPALWQITSAGYSLLGLDAPTERTR